MKKILASVLVSLMLFANVSALAQETEKSTLVQTIVSAVPLSTWKTNPVANPKLAFSANSSITDEQLLMYKHMGYAGIELSFSDDELKDFEAMEALVDRLRNFENGGFESFWPPTTNFRKTRTFILPTTPAMQRSKE